MASQILSSLGGVQGNTVICEPGIKATYPCWAPACMRLWGCESERISSLPLKSSASRAMSTGSLAVQ